MAIIETKFNLKIFQIDKCHFELENKNIDEMIEAIRENHKKYIYANKEDILKTKPHFETYEEEDFKYYSYCFNQLKDQNYWKLFLPKELTQQQEFEMYEFSYVLFIVYNSNIYAVIGGSGMNVIKKYVNDYFGIELYQHFANLNEDIALSINTRGVTGNLSQRSNTFNSLQTIRESLVYSEIPKRLKLIVREELKHGLFQKYKLPDNSPIMEIGAYFSIRKKLSFKELKSLIIDIEAILEDKTNYVNLSLFNRVKEKTLIDRLDNELTYILVTDILLHNTPEDLRLHQFEIIEVVNYKKLEKFYECNNYKLHIKNKLLKNDKTIENRKDLYYEVTKYINQNLENEADQFEISKKLYETSIIGMIEDKEVTFGTFLSHIVTELELDNIKFFRIDNQWFQLDDLYLAQIQSEAINNYNTFELRSNILNTWFNKNTSEDEYNLSHQTDKHFVFDKKIKDNIELCDVMYLDNNDIYFIHVKDGFNTHMRSLYSQITLASQRLWNDLNNKDGSSYFIETLEYYNRFNPANKLDSVDILSRIQKGELKVTFVMAYRNLAYKGKTAIEKIELSKSNIAKFSLVQTVNEIRSYKSFDIKIVDISQIV